MTDEQYKCLQYSTSGTCREGRGSRYSRYVGGTHVGHGKMPLKFSRLMFETCLDFVKLFCDDIERSQTRLKMTHTGHDHMSKWRQNHRTRILIPKWDMWPLGQVWVCLTSISGVGNLSIRRCDSHLRDGTLVFAWILRLIATVFGRIFAIWRVCAQKVNNVGSYRRNPFIRLREKHRR